MSRDQEKKKAAKSIWWNESEALQKTLTDVSKKVLGEKEAVKYILSSKSINQKNIYICKHTYFSVR